MARYLMALALLLACTLLCIQHGSAAPRQPYLIELDDPETMAVLSRLGRSLIRVSEFDHSKRGVDFGMNRGFSGTQAAKHLLGLAAANYAVGPGRKKRSQLEVAPVDVEHDVLVNSS